MAVVFTLRFAGQVIAGGVTSCTVTVNVHVEVFNPPSVAVAVTVVVPRANVLPDAFLHVHLRLLRLRGAKQDFMDLSRCVTTGSAHDNLATLFVPFQYRTRT